MEIKSIKEIYEDFKKGNEFLGYLATRYDRRKSFYKKAKVYKVGNYIVLVSYDTIVAKVEKVGNIIGAQVFGYYSATTRRHTNELLDQFDIKAPTAKELKNTDDKGEYIWTEASTYKDLLDYLSFE